MVRWLNDMALTRRLYWKEGDWVYLMQFGWGGLIDREKAILIGGSMK